MFRKKPDPNRRTVQPTQPANVFSYHSSRSGADTARGRYEPPESQRQGVARLKHVPTLLAAIIIVLSLGYASLLSPSPRLMVSATEKGKSLQRDEQIYAKYIESQLSGSLQNKSKLTFDSSTMIESLQKQFPEVASAVVTLPLLGHKPIVKIAVASPAFILASQNGAYYVSDKGVPLVRVSDVQNQIEQIATVTDDSNLPITVGKQVLPTDTVAFIQEIIQQLVATNTEFESVTLPLEANELQIRLKGQPYFIRFNTLQDARTQVGTLLAVQKRLEEGNETPKEYIDLRVEERAYYK